MNNDLIFYSKADFRTFDREVMPPPIVSKSRYIVIINNRAWSGGETLMSDANLIKVMILFL